MCVCNQEISTPAQLYDQVVEVHERLVLHQDNCQIRKQVPLVTGRTKEEVGTQHCVVWLYYIFLFPNMAFFTLFSPKMRGFLFIMSKVKVL